MRSGGTCSATKTNRKCFPLTFHLHPQIIMAVNLEHLALRSWSCAAVLKLQLSLLLEPKHGAGCSGWLRCGYGELRADWSPAPHCHAVNPHHMVRPLGLLTDEPGEFTDLCLRAVGDRAALSGEKPEAPADRFACLGRTFFPIL